jgi:hypothetical protein
VHPDQDLARAWLGPVYLLDVQDLGGGTGGPVQSCFHECRLAVTSGAYRAATSKEVS